MGGCLRKTCGTEDEDFDCWRNDCWIEWDMRCTLVGTACIITERLSFIYTILLPERKTTFPLE